MQVEPIKPVLTAPDYILLRCDGPLSNFAFNFNVRRYTEGVRDLDQLHRRINKVGLCRLTLGIPC